jgi:phosphatidylserine/phosphatidylglycerophosphate/cardiolipin synthase-like enzyme
MGHYYINDANRRELTDKILDMIRTAKSYIKISSFIMEDYQVVTELCNLSASGKVAVFVISNRNNKEGEEFKATSPKKSVEGIHTHQMFLQNLFYSGAHVRLLENLHAKFILADGKEAMLMSANIAANSLTKNVETGITLAGDDQKDLELIFDTMYNYADIVHFGKSDYSDVVKKSVRKLPNEIFSGLIGNVKLTAISKFDTNLSECHQTTLYDAIIRIIDDAQSFVYIVTWVFKDKRNTLFKLQKAIDKAIKRGVKVMLFCNNNVSAFNQSLQEQYTYLMGSKGCEAYSNNNNHSKCVLSEKEGILFTANIDGNNGLLEGFEVGCMMDKEQHQQALNHVKELITKAKN